MDKRIEQKQSLLDKVLIGFGSIGDRWIYLLTIIFLAFPYIIPLGLPVPIDPMVKEVYDIFEEAPEGSVIMYSQDTSVGGWPELGPGAIAVMQHLFKLPVKVIYMSFAQDGPMLIDKAMNEVNKGNKVYGEDYVILPYISGQQAAMARFATNIHSTAVQDKYGTQIEDIPMMKDVRSYKDIYAIFTTDTGFSCSGYLAQWVTPYNALLIGHMIGVMTPGFMPYYPNSIKIMNSLSSGAMYEYLVGIKGKGLQAMDTISTGHILMIGLIILGNISWVYLKLKGAQK